MSESSTVVKTETRRVSHIRATYKNEDTLIKSVVHTLEDGTEKREYEFVKNKHRAFYITRKPKRNHEQKKSTERVENVQKFTCTQSDLVTTLPLKLGFPDNRKPFRFARDNPYIYGIDQHIEFLEKKQDNEGVDAGLYKYGAMDIEYDVNDRFTDKVIVNSVACGKNVHVSIHKGLLEHINNPLEKLYACSDTFLRDYLKDGLKVKFEIVEPREVILNPIRKMHEWKPDVCGFWNMDYDMPKMIDALKLLGIPLEEAFCDPAIPASLRRFKYSPGPESVVSKSGVMHRLGVHERWHQVFCSGFFEWMCAMTTFAEIRSQDAKRSSFSLNAILAEFVGIQKMTFPHIEKVMERDITLTKETIDQLDDLVKSMRKLTYKMDTIKVDTKSRVSKLREHMIMQKEYPIEYCVYAAFDPYSMILLENKIKDFSLKLPIFMGSTPLRDLPKRSKRLTNYVHDFCVSNNLVAGAMYANYPEETITGLNDWIVTADAFMKKDNGIRCMKGNPYHVTNLFCNGLEIDLTSSYPSIFIATRTSRSTSFTTVGTFNNMTIDYQSKQAMVSYMHGTVNAMDVSVVLFHKPDAFSVLSLCEQKLQP